MSGFRASPRRPPGGPARPNWYLWEGGAAALGRSEGIVPTHEHHAIRRCRRRRRRGRHGPFRVCCEASSLGSPRSSTRRRRTSAVSLPRAARTRCVCGDLTATTTRRRSFAWFATSHTKRRPRPGDARRNGHHRPRRQCLHGARAGAGVVSGRRADIPVCEDTLLHTGGEANAPPPFSPRMPAVRR